MFAVDLFDFFSYLNEVFVESSVKLSVEQILVVAEDNLGLNSIRGDADLDRLT